METQGRKTLSYSVIPMSYGLEEIEKNIKDFELVWIKTHSIFFNPYVHVWKERD